MKNHPALGHYHPVGGARRLLDDLGRLLAKGDAGTEIYPGVSPTIVPPEDVFATTTRVWTVLDRKPDHGQQDDRKHLHDSTTCKKWLLSQCTVDNFLPNFFKKTQISTVIKATSYYIN